MRRTLGLLLAGCLLLSGCSLFGGPDPDPAAKALAQALTKRDVAGLTFARGTGAAAQRELTAILAAMKDVPATVTATGLSTDGDTAKGTLVWRWKVANRVWVTRSPLTLRKSGDSWRPVWTVRLVHPRLTTGQSLRETALLSTRGDILGARGQHLVTDRRVILYGFEKKDVPEGAAVRNARALGRLLGIDAAAYAERVRKAGPKAYVEALTLRDTDPQPSESAVLRLDGARMTPAFLPLAPSRTFATALLGRVGAPTAEMITKSGGALAVTDQVGIGGLEARYDDQLRGTPGAKVSLVDTSGDGTILFRAEPIAGKPLRTTLDANAQRVAEEALAALEPASALVAIRPSTGAVIAAANGPGSQALNTATYGRYAPGSTFKIVSSLALLRSGVTPRTMVDCPTSVTVDGKRFENYDDYPPSALGRIPFRTAIANSCNTAVIGLRDKITGDTLTQAAAALGLGVDHDLGFPAYFGQAPAASTKTEAAADLIGQGKVLASPMAMAAVAASVGAGKTVVPFLLPDHAAKADPATPLTTTEAGQLRTLLRAVVTDGSGRLLADLPDGPAYAKTGTAEYGDAKPPRTHAWMVGIHDDLAVAVFVDDGASGSGVAGPVLKKFLTALR